MALAGPAERPVPRSAGAILHATLAILWGWSRSLVSIERVKPAKPRASRARILHIFVGVSLCLAVIVAAMLFADSWAIARQRALPEWLVNTFFVVTDFGRSGWVLTPVGALIVTAAFIAALAPRQFDRLVIATLASRIGYVFVAVSLPGLLVAVIKRIVGRARPYTWEKSGPFEYAPFNWDVSFASLPSGHGTTAFATAVAVGTLFPSLRIPLLLFAFVIAVSRVAVSAHYPSDVIAGAVIGTVGALMVRSWFAARRLAFVRTTEGTVLTLPGPSMRRVRDVLRRAFRR